MVGSSSSGGGYRRRSKQSIVNYPYFPLLSNDSLADNLHQFFFADETTPVFINVLKRLMKLLLLGDERMLCSCCNELLM